MKKATITRSSLRRIVMVAALAGIVAGLGAVILVRGLPSNGQADASCKAALELADAVRPFKRGEVANFLPSEAPVSVSDLTFQDAEGNPRSMADYAGRTVLLNLWATWCVPCRKEMPALDRLQAELGSDAFTVVTVNIDRRNTERAKAFFSEIGIKNLPMLADPTMGVFETLKSRGRAIGMPTTMLVDPNGCEIGTMHGAAEWDSDDAKALIEAALKAEPKS